VMMQTFLGSAHTYLFDPKQTLLATASANATLPLTQSYDKVLDCSRPA